MKVIIERSPQYRQARALETGQDIPDRVEAEISADIPADLRPYLAREGKYPTQITLAACVGLSYTGLFLWPWKASCLDCEAEMVGAQPDLVWEAIRRAIAHTAEVQAREEAEGAEKERQNQARRKTEVEAEAAAEAKTEVEAEAKAAFIALWAARDATDNQRARYDAGLLDEEEIKQAIRDATFAPLDGKPRYENLEATDCEHAEHCGYDGPCKVCYRSADASSATAEQWDRMQALRALAPEGSTITLRIHTATPDGDDCESAERYGIQVMIHIGPWTLRREYAAPNA